MNPPYFGGYRNWGVPPNSQQERNLLHLFSTERIRRSRVVNALYFSVLWDFKKLGSIPNSLGFSVDGHLFTILSLPDLIG
jgi:hypothetical protein